MDSRPRIRTRSADPSTPARRAREALLVAGLLASLALGLAPGAVASGAVPGVEARAHILVDFHTGRVLSEHAADSPMEPASLTKLMTSYVVFSEIRAGHVALDDLAHISRRAWETGGSRTFVEVDSRVPVEVLLKGVIVQSGNDASVALAEHVAGSVEAFAVLMNEQAQRLGMSASHFTNPHGLPDPDLYVTPRDMSRLASALIRDFPQFYSWYSLREFEYNGIVQPSRNQLLGREPGVDGMKTGYTRAAGYCLVVSAVRDGMRLISVVMGAESPQARVRDSRTLLTHGYRGWETHRVYGAGQPVTDVRIWQGEAPRLGLGLDEDLYVTVPRGQYSSLDASLEVDARITAPVQAGEPRGTVRLRLGEELLAERRLLALETVGLGNLWQRALDYVRARFD
jgi:serine-type D-Ala-D-Ala carboxypeptidase (penicillin-binding protein 5/6)